MTQSYVCHLIYFQVSGGLSVGFGITETAIKEAYEEASIPRNLLNNLKAAGSVS